MGINFCIFPNEILSFLKLNEMQLTQIFLPLLQLCLEAANTVKGIREEWWERGENKNWKNNHISLISTENQTKIEQRNYNSNGNFGTPWREC